MKTFEEQFAAWVDGTLEGSELTRFESELAERPEAAADKEAALKIGELLRAQAAPPALTNGDFFNLQIQQRITAEGRTARAEKRGWFWSLPRLTWAGAACLLLAAALMKWMIPLGPQTAQAGGPPYFAQVVEAWPAEAGISASTVYDPRDNLTVLWLDGLDYIPANYQVK